MEQSGGHRNIQNRPMFPGKETEGLWLHFSSLPAPHHIHPGDQVLNRASRVGKRYPVDPGGVGQRSHVCSHGPSQAPSSQSGRTSLRGPQPPSPKR